MNNYQARTALVLLLNLLAVITLLGTSSVVMMGGIRHATALGRRVEPDSIALAGSLERYDVDLEDAQTILVRGSGRGLVYLVRDDSTVLGDAAVHLEIPRIGLSASLVQAEPGRYALLLQEEVRVRAPVPLLEARGYAVKNLRVTVNREDLSGKMAAREATYAARNFLRHDLTGAGLDIFAEPKQYELSWQVSASAQIVAPDGTPAANLSVTVELPRHGYTETISTDAGGWVHIDRLERATLTIQGGRWVEVSGPVFIAEPDEPMVLFWWEDPTPRCEVETEVTPLRQAVEPGLTGIYDLNVINRGNRPDTYTIYVDGIPAHWVEIDSPMVTLLPMFGQTVRVAVTPERTWETKPLRHTFTLEARSGCTQQFSGADVKVLAFYEPDIDIYGSSYQGAAKLDQSLRGRAVRGTGGPVQAIVTSNGPLPETAWSDVAKLGGTVRREYGLIHGMAVTLPAAKLSELSQLNWVARVEENREVKVLLAESVPLLGAPQVWAKGLTGKGVKVAVVDTGAGARCRTQRGDKGQECAGGWGR